MPAASRAARATPVPDLRGGHALLLVLLCLLAACGGRAPVYQSGYAVRSSGSYEPPGPPEDPWGPYIREASTRFGVPERWIREVMRQESGGHQYLHGQPTTSSAGAMGLMQVMPQTYDGLRQRYGLGSDPYDPHDNIIAGSGYIREMYDRFGSPMFLAAYNAGPGRVGDYLAGGGRLPSETANYLASIAPRLGDSAPPAGAPPVAYAEAAPPATASQPVATPAPTVAASAPALVLASAASPIRNSCDPNAAYDPDAPCPTLPAPAPAPIGTAIYQPAYDPGPVSEAPRASAPAEPAPAALPIPPRPPAAGLQLAAASAMETPFAAGRLWSLQVGAFRSPMQARIVAETARLAARDLLGSARVEVPTTTPLGDTVLYRARLAGISSSAASLACARLGERRIPCMVVPPGQGS